MSVIDKYLQSIGRVLSWVAAGTLLLMVLITLVDVFARFLKYPIVGTIEVTSYAMLITATSAIVYTALQQAHVKAGLLNKLLPKRVNRVVDSISLLLSMVAVVVIAWRGVLLGLEEYAKRTYSPIMSIPTFPFRLYLGFCFILLVLVILRDFQKSITEVWK